MTTTSPHRVGVRAEDKNRWERRAPLTPEHVGELVREHGLRIQVQASELRVFRDEEYAAAGAELVQELGGCRVVLGVKEIPTDKLRPDTAYVFFSHTIKGQAANMPLLHRLLELGATLVDYEPIVDERGRRLIFFGRHAGYAGMIDTLWALGRRLAWEGFHTPLEDIRPAHRYADLDDATDHVARVGERIRRDGVPRALWPLAVGFTGSGQVCEGAREVFGRLPVLAVAPDELARLEADTSRPRNVLFETLFERRHRVERIADAGFDAGEYRDHPDRYRSALGAYLPHLTALVNGIYWEPSRPRLVTWEHVRALWADAGQPRLRVIGDVTCDVEGSIQTTLRATDPGDPVYVVDPDTREARSGVEGRGVVMLAVDNLPCELPRAASQHFGDSLLRFVPALARCDWSRPWDRLELPDAVRRAVVAHQGSLAPRFRHLEEKLAEAR